MTNTSFRSRGWLEVALRCERARAFRRSASSGFSRLSILAAMLMVLAPVCILLTQSTLHAAVIAVTTIGDPGPVGTCDLRDAIINANSENQSGSTNCVAGTGNDTIIFSTSGTITLGGNLPGIVHTLTIDGSGQSITINGDSSYQVLTVEAFATLNLSYLTIADGNAAGGSGFGGGIYNLGTVTVTNSTFFDNSAGSGLGGGAIENTSGSTLTVINSTFSGNSAPGGFGGGIRLFDATVTVTNSTFSGNSATTGGAIYNLSGTVTVSNSILADSTGGNCAGTITSGGYNISANSSGNDSTCSFGSSLAANGDTIGDNVSDSNINLGSLASNGGPTETIALGSGSYAIDAVPIAGCPAIDQRGYARPDPDTPPETACDIGAYESGSAAGLLVVNTTGDPGPAGTCDLRGAIDNANSPGVDTTGGACAVGTANDTITFSVSGKITLTSSLPAIQNTLEIDGPASGITIDGANKYLILSVSPGSLGPPSVPAGTLTLIDLTIAHGNNGTSPSNAGGVNNAGTLTVESSTFVGNVALFGSAIFNTGTLTVNNSTFWENGNDNSFEGGAILNTLTATIVNSTIAHNTALFGSGIFNDAGTVILENSILSKNATGAPAVFQNCSGGVINGGYDISDDGTCGFGKSKGANKKAIGDKINPQLSLDGLQNNGGPTDTVALKSNSPAIDAVPHGNANCPGFDQRGLARPDAEDGPSGACDIGAYETSPIVVNTTDDPGTASECSLREAIENANSPGSSNGTCIIGTGADIIEFNIPGTGPFRTITLGSELPTILKNVTIDGTGDRITIDGNSNQVFFVFPGATLSLNNLTISDGSSPAGGAIQNDGTLNVTNCTLSNNSAPGGIGGAIDNFGTANVTNSTFYENSAGTGIGGAIFNDATLNVTNCTLVDNSAGLGGGIETGGTATVSNTILFDNGSANCAGTITNGGFNISFNTTTDDSCAFGTSTGASGQTLGDNVEPLLVGLAYNGGPTETFRELAKSPSINAVPIANCPATDQRGDPRPDPKDGAAGPCDVGAFESRQIGANRVHGYHNREQHHRPSQHFR